MSFVSPALEWWQQTCFSCYCHSPRPKQSNRVTIRKQNRLSWEYINHPFNSKVNVWISSFTFNSLLENKQKPEALIEVTRLLRLSTKTLTVKPGTINKLQVDYMRQATNSHPLGVWVKDTGAEHVVVMVISRQYFVSQQKTLHSCRLFLCKGTRQQVTWRARPTRLLLSGSQQHCLYHLTRHVPSSFLSQRWKCFFPPTMPYCVCCV